MPIQLSLASALTKRRVAGGLSFPKPKPHMPAHPPSVPQQPLALHLELLGPHHRPWPRRRGLEGLFWELSKSVQQGWGGGPVVGGTGVFPQVIFEAVAKQAAGSPGTASPRPVAAPCTGCGS